MLDAFIIEKIQQERELRDGDRTPLRIEILQEPAHDATPAEEKDTERGIAAGRRGLSLAPPALGPRPPALA